MSGWTTTKPDKPGAWAYRDSGGVRYGIVRHKFGTDDLRFCGQAVGEANVHADDVRVLAGEWCPITLPATPAPAEELPRRFIWEHKLNGIEGIGCKYASRRITVGPRNTIRLFIDDAEFYDAGFIFAHWIDPEPQVPLKHAEPFECRMKTDGQLFAGRVTLHGTFIVHNGNGFDIFFGNKADFDECFEITKRLKVSE